MVSQTFLPITAGRGMALPESLHILEDQEVGSETRVWLCKPSRPTPRVPLLPVRLHLLKAPHMTFQNSTTNWRLSSKYKPAGDITATRKSQARRRASDIICSDISLPFAEHRYHLCHRHTGSVSCTCDLERMTTQYTLKLITPTSSLSLDQRQGCHSGQMETWNLNPRSVYRCASWCML